MRAEVLCRLAEDLLGPLEGRHEVVPEAPLLRYPLGVLGPQEGDEQQEVFDPHLNNEAAGEAGMEDEDEAGNAPDLGMHLDPRRRPSTMGVTFHTNVAEPTPMDLAISLGRYLPAGVGFQRHSHLVVLNWETLCPDGLNTETDVYVAFEGQELDRTMRVCDPDGADLRLWIRWHQTRGADGMACTIALVNLLSGERDEETHLFQPELRVLLRTPGHLGNRTELLPEEALADLLHEGREALVRGHLCSATWHHHDHQIGALRAESEFASRPPFCWVDGGNERLPEDVRHPYAQSHLRSEHLPVVDLPAPNMDPAPDDVPSWRERDLGVRATDLAEAGPEDVVELLGPLVSGYEEWGRVRFDPLGRDDPRRDLFAAVESASQRMRSGLERLTTDQEALNAFRVANRAIHQSNMWAAPNNDPFRWRKFQLAFCLLSLESTLDRDHPEREMLDLVWVPTGGGKTEAYLLLLATLLVHRRITCGEEDPHGVAVLTRYTLRLLTIQQFRRTLGVVTALEYLRATGWSNAWAPLGVQAFGLGLWVGGGVTPNWLLTPDQPHRFGASIHNIYRRLSDHRSRKNAVDLLLAGHRMTEDSAKRAPDPAQVLTCPACAATLSFGRQQEERGVVHWVVSYNHRSPEALEVERHLGLEAGSVGVQDSPGEVDVVTLSIDLRGARHDEHSIERMWGDLQQHLGLNMLAMRASRPGYFPLCDERGEVLDFEIRCPSPRCPLHQRWAATTPSGASRVPRGWAGRLEGTARGIPIPAWTVDEQVYGRLPDVVVSTVDKFARLPFEPRAGMLFGNATHHSQASGFNRTGHGVALANRPTPPDLIIQDELHLIEGALGSMVGFYETLVEGLIEEGGHRPKYVASTATISAAEAQVRCLFDRDLTLFPPRGPTWADRGLVQEAEHGQVHGTGEGAGRLYVGLCPGGGSALGFQRDLYASLAMSGLALSASDAPDRYWSVAGYYNAVRELGGGKALLEQDVMQATARLAARRGERERVFDLARQEELSSRLESTRLPALLDRLEHRQHGEEDCVDFLVATSMFGTGVDVTRLNLMLVAGQPKSTAQYIQASGRVGRRNGALVSTFLRASRPRDLDHFERFLGYHLQLQRHVEPVTVRPFSEAVIDRAAGPALVGWMRNARNVTRPWMNNDMAATLTTDAGVLPEIDAFLARLERRNAQQPEDRRMETAPPNLLRQRMTNRVDEWKRIADLREGLSWASHRSRDHVVLANEAHVILAEDRHAGVGHSVFSPGHPAPNSLRTVDGTVGVAIRGHDRQAQPVRLGQIVYAHGPGSNLETTNGPVVVQGLHTHEAWRGNMMRIEDHEVFEGRLQQTLPRPFGRMPRLHTVPSNAALGEQWNDRMSALDTWGLPSWSLCMERERHGEGRPAVLFRATREDASCPHPGCQGHNTNRPASVLFVRYCTDGHLDDVPWRSAVCGPGTTCRGWIRWEETTATLAGTTLRCSACPGQVTLLDVAQSTRAIGCNGRHPHVNQNESECQASTRMSSRQATLLWQPSTQRVVSLPQEEDVFNVAMRLYRQRLDRSNGNLREWLPGGSLRDHVDDRILDERDRRTRRDLERLSNELVVGDEGEFIERMEAEWRGDEGLSTDASRRLYAEEHRSLVEENIPGQRRTWPNDSPNPHFVLEPIEQPLRLGAVQLVARPVSRLRTVTALAGFTRGPDTDAPRRVDLQIRDDHQQPWVMVEPGLGEGLLIHAQRGQPGPAMGGVRAQSWLRLHQERLVRAQEGVLDDGLVRRFRTLRHDNVQVHAARPEDLAESHPVFVWWHTLAHHLIRAVQADVGYSSASIRERVYADPSDGSAWSGAILLYVTEGSSLSGTLGGMVSLLPRLQRHLDMVHDSSEVCSNDPLCGDMGQDHRRMEVGCYACTLNPETSCEHQNHFLDRLLLREGAGL